jgi:hypothetical protein
MRVAERVRRIDWLDSAHLGCETRLQRTVYLFRAISQTVRRSVNISENRCLGPSSPSSARHRHLPACYQYVSPR